MSANGLTKRNEVRFCLILGILSVMFDPVLFPQVPQHVASAYDSTKEITFNGIASQVLTKAHSGLIMGSHLLMETDWGTLDVSLGRLAECTTAIVAGQEVEVTGVMQQFKHRPVMMARILKIGNQVYSVRDKHGIPMSRQALERAGVR